MRLTINKIYAFLIFAFLFENVSAQMNSQAEASFLSNIQKSVGKKFLPFNLSDLNGAKYTDQNLRGKITLVNFWFESCAPCLAEFHELNKVYDRYKTNSKFQFISFTFENRKDALKISKQYSLPYSILCLDRKDCNKLNFQNGFPTTIITDTVGNVAYIKVGGPIDSLDVQTLIHTTLIPKLKELLKNKP